MVPRRGNTSWFECLRRDAKLFVAVGCLSVLMGLLQPLTVAAAAPTSFGFVICTTYGVGTASDDSREHPRMAECPLCLSGHACGFQFSPVTPQLSVLVPPAWLQSGAPQRPWGERFQMAPAGDSPPSIRAPPALA